jgi:hypothetical protein
LIAIPGEVPDPSAMGRRKCRSRIPLVSSLVWSVGTLALWTTIHAGTAHGSQ